ncbi:hypothetical protein AB1Y20_013770 [Prymnesium parvum]|uniref:Uncharacterized protein n=1 Tax=Prymnesium parvum TaxID=97485 RepID=A0AB34IF46_PRYPA
MFEWLGCAARPRRSESRAYGWPDMEELKLRSFPPRAAFDAAEARRRAWFSFYLGRKEFSAAARLCVTPLDEARLLAARLASAHDPRLAARRAQLFDEALSARAWRVSEVLCGGGGGGGGGGGAEAARLAAARRAAAEMRAAALEGRLERALALAATEEERAALAALAGRAAAWGGEAHDAAARAIQSAARRGRARALRGLQRQEQAAIKLQRAYRGAFHRRTMAEAMRVVKLQCHVASGEWEKAFETAVSKEERRHVIDAKRAGKDPPCRYCVQSIRECLLSFS